jgi:uroporphyrin-3 C-methyltransferase
MSETSSSAPATRSSPLKQPALLIALVALALAATTWVASGSRITGLQEELAKRLSDGDGAIRDSRSDSRQAKEETQALTARVALLEAKLNEAQGQQAALESMYQDLARGRDERLLAEIEQSVAIASQQLQLAGNVEAALIALQSADARLAQNGNGQFATVRRLIGRDIDRLKALPQADISGMAAKLESVVAVVDTLPLAYAQRPPRSATKEAEKAAMPAMTEGAYWSGLLGGAWNEIKQMIRIERIDQNAPALLAPNQALFLRENLRLRLINARLSLLQRDAASFRDDITLAVKWMELYFDMRAPAVKAAHDNLQRLSTSNLNMALPKLDETLAALRNVRRPTEKH